MSYNSEDLQDKTNKLVEEAASEDRTSSEHREDGGDEDNQPFNYNNNQLQSPLTE